MTGRWRTNEVAIVKEDHRQNVMVKVTARKLGRSERSVSCMRARLGLSDAEKKNLDNHTITVHAPRSFHNELRAEVQKRGTTVSAFVRYCVKQEIERAKDDCTQRPHDQERHIGHYPDDQSIHPLQDSG